MKTIKFFSFLMLLSIAWIGCEDRTKVKVETTTDNTEAALEDAYMTSKTEMEKTIVDLRNSIDAKIQAAEAEFEAATDEGKAEITVRLDGLRKQRNDLEVAAKRIGDATAEGWADIERETAQVIADIKAAID
jgi:hypothetical protein